MSKTVQLRLLRGMEADVFLQMLQTYSMLTRRQMFVKGGSAPDKLLHLIYYD